MDSATYEVEAHVEETHWWFLGRRRLLKKAIKELELPDDAVPRRGSGPSFEPGPRSSSDRPAVPHNENAAAITGAVCASRLAALSSFPDFTF